MPTGSPAGCRSNSRARAWIFAFRCRLPTRRSSCRLFAVASDTLAVQAAALRTVRERLFAAATETLPVTAQERIVHNVNFRMRYDSVKVLTFDDAPYLQIRTLESSYTCGIGSVGDPSRLGGAIDEVGFPILRDIGFGNDSLTGKLGFAVAISLKAVGCGNGSAGDVVTLFASADAVRQFAAGEVTGQQLLDRSAVVFKGRRVEVLLRCAS